LCLPASGVSPSGKAAVFGTAMRRFESFHPNTLNPLHHMLLFAGSSHPELAQQLAADLQVTLAPLHLDRFPDGEIAARVPQSVRGQDLFLLQTIALDPNNYLVELLILIDAFKRASANSVTVVIPYFGYCRQDRRDKPREPITARLVANMLVTAGAAHVITIDLHAGQLEGFFDIPVDHLHAMPILAQEFQQFKPEKTVVVAPDIGSVKLAHSYASFLNTGFAIVDKHRITATEVDAVALIGDVKGKDVLLADDMCSTAGTLVSAAKACHGKGANRIFAAATHGLLVGNALQELNASLIDTLLVSNTIPCAQKVLHCSKLRSVSVAPLIGQAIRCMIQGK
jgi:ribose-phosphate pyrophosphokinase